MAPKSNYKIEENKEARALKRLSWKARRIRDKKKGYTGFYARIVSGNRKVLRALTKHLRYNKVDFSLGREEYKINPKKDIEVIDAGLTIYIVIHIRGE